MKKINIFVLCVLLLVMGLACMPAAAHAEGGFSEDKKSYSNIASTYTLKEVVDDKNLGYGVHYQRELSTLRTDATGYLTGNDAGLGSTSKALLHKDYGEQVNLLTLAPDTKAELIPYALLRNGSWLASSVRNAAKYYEETHPGKCVIAAVNGDFFAIGYNCKTSTGATISDGEFYKTSSSHGSYQNIAIRNHATGKKLSTITSPQTTDVQPVLTVYDDTGAMKKFPIDFVNNNVDNLEEGKIGLYYAKRLKLGSKFEPAKTPKNVWVVKAVGNEEVLAVSSTEIDFYGKGKIAEYSEERVDIEKGGLFAVASTNSEVNELLKKGVLIRCQYEYTNPDVQDVDNVIGFPFDILHDGNIAGDSNRHPRTVIGQKDDGTVVLAVVDGRQGASDMYGATGSELAAMMAFHGCVDVWNLDGGGSSTLLVRKIPGWDYKNGYRAEENSDSDWWVTNSPSDGNERHDGNCLLVVVDVPIIENEFAKVTSTEVKMKFTYPEGFDPERKIFISFDGKEMLPVEKDGTITVPDLEVRKAYTFNIYEKLGEEYEDLKSTFKFTTGFAKPDKLTTSISFSERNGQPMLRLLHDIASGGVKKIITKLGEGEDEQFSVGAGNQYIPLSIDNLNKLNKAEFSVLFLCSELRPEDTETILFPETKIEFNGSFVNNEIAYRYKNALESILEK